MSLRPNQVGHLPHHMKDSSKHHLIRNEYVHLLGRTNPIVILLDYLCRNKNTSHNLLPNGLSNFQHIANDNGLFQIHSILVEVLEQIYHKMVVWNPMIDDKDTLQTNHPKV